jgi:hypothetical protein
MFAFSSSSSFSSSAHTFSTHYRGEEPKTALGKKKARHNLLSIRIVVVDEGML